MSVLELRERLMPKLPAPSLATVGEVSTDVVAPGFLVEADDKLLLTMPIEQAQDGPGEVYVHLAGRFVEAGKENNNGALWSEQDLQFGLPTVAYGPLNWLHEERKVVGAISEARYVDREAAAAQDSNPYIAAGAVAWKWLYPREVAQLKDYAEQKKAWYSMECISREIACGSCSGSYAYSDVMLRKDGCEHIRERSASRRFVDPIFMGGAIIVPPVKPGWANAHLDVVREAASLAEAHFAGGVPTGLTGAEAELMVAQVLDYAGARSSSKS